MASALTAGAAVWANSSSVVLIWLTGNLSGGALRAACAAQGADAAKNFCKSCAPSPTALRRPAAKTFGQAGRGAFAPPPPRLKRPWPRGFRQHSYEKPPDAAAESRTRLRRRV